MIFDDYNGSIISYEDSVEKKVSKKKGGFEY